MAGKGENGVSVEHPPEDDRREDRGKSSRVTVTASRGLWSVLLTSVVAAACGVGGAAGHHALKSPEASPVVAPKDDEHQAREQKRDEKLDKILEALQTLQVRMAAVEAQGTREVLDKIEGRLRKTEEDVAAIRAIEGRK